MLLFNFVYVAKFLQKSILRMVNIEIYCRKTKALIHVKSQNETKQQQQKKKNRRQEKKKHSLLLLSELSSEK